MILGSEAVELLIGGDAGDISGSILLLRWVSLLLSLSVAAFAIKFETSQLIDNFE